MSELNFNKTAGNTDSNSYSVATETMSVENKLDILKGIGREDLVGIFKDWKPRVSKAKKRGAPLDQRISITVTDGERNSLNDEIVAIKKVGEKISMSQYIRNKALGNVDINEWRKIAEEELAVIQNVKNNEKDLRKKIKSYYLEMEDEEDESEVGILQMKIKEISDKLNKILPVDQKRKNRLSGRMSMAEAETVKWRAQRLTVSTSDFLRMMIFNLIPGDTADAHMNFEAKMRFYISIIDVADRGWGEPPRIYNCSQCENYMDEIYKLKERIRLMQAV